MTPSKVTELPQAPKKILGIEMSMKFNFRRFRKGLYFVFSIITLLFSIGIVIDSSTWSPFNLVINHLAFMFAFASALFDVAHKDLVIADLKKENLALTVPAPKI